MDTDGEPRPRWVTIDLTDPAQLGRLTRSGAIWTLPPTHWQDAVDAISAGAIRLDECEGVPEDVAAFLSRYGTPASTRPRVSASGLASSVDAAVAPEPAASPDKLGWVCPVHGATHLRTMTSPRGRVYLQCVVGSCPEFERALGQESGSVWDHLNGP